MDLGGVFPPIVTPFDSTEEVDLGRLKQNMSVWKKKPFKGRCQLIQSRKYGRTINAHRDVCSREWVCNF